MRTSREVTIPVTIERSSDVSIVEQLVTQLRLLVVSRALRSGDELPSSRALASHLGVARGSVVSAYEQLVAEGWFDSASGRSTRVNPRLHDVHPQVPEVTRRPVGSAKAPLSASRHSRLIDLRPGRPMSTGLVSAAWKAAWRRAADAELDVAVGALGWMPLREAISEHLRFRAVVRDPRLVAVTSGGREGLSEIILATGARSVGVEDPGYPSLHRVLRRLGTVVVPLPTDDRGLITSQLPDQAPDLVIVTPSHQYPLGGSLPIDRRLELLEWAERHDVLVVEDDYDSELRYTSAPLPALASLDVHGRVVLLGTFAKVMSPVLATGYLVLPATLVGEIEQLRRDLGQSAGLVGQRAMADYLGSGELSRHVQRMRQLYRRRRAVVTKALSGLDDATVYPMDGGLHCVIEHSRDEKAVIDEIRRGGVVVSALSDYWAGRGSRSGLVLGFGAVSDEELAQGLGVVRRVLS